MPPIRIAVSANFTAEPLKDPLAHLLDLLKIDAQIEFAPFDQVFQTLLDPASVFSTNDRGANIVLIDGHRWTSDDTQNLTETLSQAHFHVPVIIASGPGVEVADEDWITADSISRAHPDLIVLDPHADREARIPYTRAYFAALALRLARAIRAKLPGLPAVKVIAIDCDNTLWRGVCGEDGPDGVTLDAGRRSLQEFLVKQRQSGKLICLASKNNEEDVWETFRAHPEFPLRPEHCVSWRINWEPKSANLESLAAELSLGVDSFVFIDDDRRECGEVRDALPEALVLELPQDSDVIGPWLDNLWIFDHGKVTEEDLKRNQYYSEISARSRLERQTSSFEDFISRLELQIRIEPLTDASMPRAAQLTQRTNQMNFSTVRRTEQELSQALALDELEGRIVHVKDRFGDYGLVGLMLLSQDEPGESPLGKTIALPLRLTIDTFLLSCRAMGRGVEHVMLREAARIAESKDLTSVAIRYKPTRKNTPARALLDSLHGAVPIEGGYRIPAAQLAGFVFKPSQAKAPAPETPAKVEAHKATPHGDYVAIAAICDDPEKLLAALSPKASSKALLAESATETEQKLAGIWATMLPIQKLSLDADFFDLGGHSLLAVQLLTRIREAFGIELSLDLIYSDKLTIRRLAAIIDNGGSIPQEDTGELSEEEYAALLAEVENLSEEEVQALLLSRDGGR